MSTAFIAGATGYTGREVVRVLVERGVRAVAHVRPDTSRLAEWRGRLTALGAEVDATPWDEEAMTATLTALRPDLVFALLGTTRARGKGTGDTYESVDYGLSALLLRAAARCGSRPRFVYLSSAGVSASSSNSYIAVRWRLETELRASGLPFTIARPSFITGPDRDEGRAGERIGSAVADGLLALTSVFGGAKLRARYRSTTPAILASALVRHGLDPASDGKVIESEGLRG